MRGSSRRRSTKISPVGVKTEAAAPPPGRFTDQLVQCVTCGRTFVFTVEEQRQLADAGLPVVPPEQCPRCAPRTVESGQKSVERVEQGVAREEAQPAASSPRPAPPAPRPTLHASRSSLHEADEFAGQYTVLAYGHVKAYDETRGLGTLVDDDTGREYRFYNSALEGVDALTLGQAVEFEVSRKGRDLEVAYILPV